jgi:hypothetical protein
MNYTAQCFTVSTRLIDFLHQELAKMGSTNVSITATVSFV